MIALGTLVLATVVLQPAAGLVPTPPFKGVYGVGVAQYEGVYLDGETDSCSAPVAFKVEIQSGIDYWGYPYTHYYVSWSGPAGCSDGYPFYDEDSDCADDGVSIHCTSACYVPGGDCFRLDVNADRSVRVLACYCNSGSFYDRYELSGTAVARY